MKKCLFLLLTLIAQHASASPAVESLQSRESLRAAVDQYVQTFMSEQAAAAAAASAPTLTGILEGSAQDGDRSELAELAKLIDASLDKHEKKDWSNEALQRELAKLGNGGRTSDRLVAKLGVTSNRVAGAGQAIHREMVSWLVARYYDRPEERDALFSLLSKFSDEIRPETSARSHDVDKLIHYLSTGTSIGMTAVMIFDFRRHIFEFVKTAPAEGAEAWQGLRTWTRGGGPRRAAQGAVEGLKTTVDSFRSTPLIGLELGSDAGFAAKLAQERQAVASSSTALVRWEGETERALTQLGREGQALGQAVPRARPGSVLGLADDVAEQAAQRDVPAGKSKHRRVAEYMGQLASQAARGFLVGGIPAGVYALNEQSEAGKIDPLEVLKVFQLLSLMEVEIEGAKLADEARKIAEELKQPRLTEAKREAARARLKDLAAGYEISEKSADGMKTRHVVGLTDLRSQYEHLQAHATRFKGVIQYPDTVGEVAAYKKRFAALKLLHWKEERVTAFLAASQELQDRVVAVDDKIRSEAAARGFAPGAQLAASLAAAELQLVAAEEGLRALNELAKPSK